jgi:hypothetical protein
VIPQIVRGEDMPGLIRYLFGLGKSNEHENQHLVAGYGDAAFSAPDELWQSEPGVQRQVRDQARDLGWQVEYPHARWGTTISSGHVWHCSLSIRAGEGQLTDSQWTEAAHAMADALGFTGRDGKAPCRWVAVRHGLSKEGNDHIHIAVNLVREDGTRADIWRDYKKASAVCADLETRFGLEHLAGRMNGRNVPEPSRADREISAVRGEAEPLRIRLERQVRACSAAADSEARFIALARQHGLLIRPRYADDSHSRVTGYAVAEQDGRQAHSSRTRTRGPVWFGGGKLASDLTLPRLRERWQADPGVTTTEALAAWSAVSTFTRSPRKTLSTGKAAFADGHMGNAADALAAAATSLEGEQPGPLSEAARRMARAAQEETARRSPAAAEAVRSMADTFMSVTLAGNDAIGMVILMQEVGRLADACAAGASTATAQRETQRASVLVRASLATLTEAAGKQAAATLTTRGTGMSEPTHEDEFLKVLTQAGVLTAQVARAWAGGRSGGRDGGTSAATDAEIARLRKAGYSEHTPYDDLLRELLGEKRWAWYAQDKARIAAAAAVTDTDRSGIYDMKQLLTRAVSRRAWEDDSVSPAASIAQILHYRVTTETEAKHPSVMRGTRGVPQSQSDSRRTPRGDSAEQHPAPAGRETEQAEGQRPSPRKAPSALDLEIARLREAGYTEHTPYDDVIRKLFGEERWSRYAEDKSRIIAAAAITDAGRAGIYDMEKLLTKGVESRAWEDDPSPARSAAQILRYRVESEVAGKDESVLKKQTGGQDMTAGRRPAADSDGTPRDGTSAQQPAAGERPAQPDQARRPSGLPAAVADALSNAVAPAGSGPRNEGKTGPAGQEQPLRSVRTNGRTSDGRDGR